MTVMKKVFKILYYFFLLVGMNQLSFAGFGKNLFFNNNKSTVVDSSAVTNTNDASNTVINVVAAENFYGNVASLIGGEYVQVKNIINNTIIDPHFFTMSTKTAILLHKADVIIINGANYDAWINPFIKHIKSNIINISSLLDFNIQNNSSINPHLWYNPKVFPTLAEKLCYLFSDLLPSHREYFQNNLREFLNRYKLVDDLADSIKSRFSHMTVTATEPVFGHMIDFFGMNMLGKRFQWIMMNDADITPKIFMEYQNLLIHNKVDLLFHNIQSDKNNLSRVILKLAKEHNIPIVPVTEIMPSNFDVITWILDTLTRTEYACDSLCNKKQINCNENNNYDNNDDDFSKKCNIEISSNVNVNE